MYIDQSFPQLQNQNQSITFGGFAESVGDTLQSGVDWIGGNFTNNTANGAAIAKINAATAASITEASKRKTEIQKGIVRIVQIVLIGLVVIYAIRSFSK